MDLLQRYDYYRKWEQDHKAEITTALANEFNANYRPEVDFVLKGSDFSGLIGLPLLGLCILLTAKYSFTIGLIVSVSIGWYIRYFAKHLILVYLKDTFEKHEYRQILEKYVADYWRPIFDNAETEEKRIEINELYTSFKTNLVNSHTKFEYWK